jgi:hypothetical protein
VESLFEELMRATTAVLKSKGTSQGTPMTTAAIVAKGSQSIRAVYMYRLDARKYELGITDPRETIAADGLADKGEDVDGSKGNSDARREVLGGKCPQQEDLRQETSPRGKP